MCDVHKNDDESIVHFSVFNWHRTFSEGRSSVVVSNEQDNLYTCPALGSFMFV